MTAIGIDLGGTWIKAVLMDDDGSIHHQTYHPTHAERGWEAAIAETVEEMKAKFPLPHPVIGLSAPGLPNPTNDAIAFMPGRLAGLENFQWSKFLRQPVHVLNDAHAALLAEARFGAAKGARNALMFTLGTGVGGGILIDGKLYQGAFQKAGHVGHVTVNAAGERDIVGTPGSLEDAIGNATVQKRSLGKFETTYALLEAYRQGDHFARWLWLDSVQKLAVSVASLVNVLSPDLVILGGGITGADDALFEPLNAFLDLYEWRPGGRQTPVVQAHFGDMAGAIGAASFALQRSV